VAAPALEVVGTGGWFTPFPVVHGSTQRGSRVLLQIDPRLPALPIGLTALRVTVGPSGAVTPFAPELGYAVTNEDYDPLLRRRKVRELFTRSRQEIPGHPLVFCAEVEAEDLAPLALLEPHPSQNFLQFRPAILALVSRLRLQLVVAGLRVECAPQDVSLISGDINFSDGFYPCDGGPLAVAARSGPLSSPGLHLALPADPALLVTIRGSFVCR
jgi:hypothetical protein